MHYSGKRSAQFWDRINAVKSPAIRAALYSMGCVLQSVEWQITKMLEEQESKTKRTR